MTGGMGVDLSSTLCFGMGAWGGARRKPFRLGNISRYGTPKPHEQLEVTQTPPHKILNGLAPARGGPGVIHSFN